MINGTEKKAWALNGLEKPVKKKLRHFCSKLTYYIFTTGEIHDNTLRRILFSLADYLKMENYFRKMKQNFKNIPYTINRPIPQKE
jgi:hypothetical protein